MTASRSIPHRRSKQESNPLVDISKAPWMADGIDFGPATAAVRDLATWALDIAERDVDDWPAARGRVRNTRRFVLAKLAGKTRHAPVEDMVFTASLLARIFDADLGLDISDAFEILASLELPLDDVPVAKPTRAKPSPNPARRHVPPPLRLCDECGVVHELGQHLGYRNAA
jgi:hypothetical protein